MMTKKFWKRVAERMVKSAGQGVAFVLTASIPADGQVNAWLLDPKTVVGAAVGMALFSLATSLASIDVGDDNESPSLVE